VIIYGSVSVVIALVLIGPLRARSLRRLGKLAPGGIAFTVANRRQFSDPLSLVGVGTELAERAITMTSGPGITADSFGLSFWDNTPFTYLGCLDWDRVHRIRVTRRQTPWRRWTATAILLDIAVGGATIELPLLSPNGSDSILATRRESEYLARELEQLRAAAQPA